MDNREDADSGGILQGDGPSAFPMLKSAHVLTSDCLLSAKLAFPICGDRESNFEVQNLEFRYSDIIVDYTRYYPEGFR